MQAQPPVGRAPLFVHGVCSPATSVCRGAPVAALPAPRIAFVLSGGCLHGVAQIGVLKALAAAGIRPDLVVGSSVGAVIGALFAAGRTPAEIERAAQAVVVSRLKRWALSWRGLWHASGVQALIRRELPCDRIEAFPIRFAAVATDAASGALTVLTGGDASRAVAASASMPGFFVPASVAGRSYLDGCLVSPLPVRVARAMGAERVIAVNTLVDPRRDHAGGVLAALLHSPRIMMRALADHEAAAADLVIAPDLPCRAPATARERQAAIDAGERKAFDVLHSPASQWLRAAPRSRAGDRDPDATSTHRGRARVHTPSNPFERPRASAAGFRLTACR